MLNQSELKELISYDSDSGVFTWKVRRGGSANSGAIAGKLSSHGYIDIQVNKKLYKAHRLAWLYVHGEWPSDHMDHINHVRDDNRIVNLRIVTRCENHKNKSLYSSNTSGVAGVHMHKQTGKWQATIRVSGRSRYLGLFNDFDAACLSRKAAELEYGFHKNHGMSGND